MTTECSICYNKRKCLNKCKNCIFNICGDCFDKVIDDDLIITNEAIQYKYKCPQCRCENLCDAKITKFDKSLLLKRLINAKENNDYKKKFEELEIYNNKCQKNWTEDRTKFYRLLYKEDWINTVYSQLSQILVEMKVNKKGYTTLLEITKISRCFEEWYDEKYHKNLNKCY